MNRQSLPLLILSALGILSQVTTEAVASSHREAPFITRHPKVDGTDLYLFRSYEPGRSDYVTLIANYSPLQDAYGGPNYFQMDPDALYEIHLDNDGDAREDLSFQFRFQNTLKDLQLSIGGKQVSVPLINIGGINNVNPDVLNVRETFSVNMVNGDRRGGRRMAVTNADTGAASFDKPVDNIGNKSIADYAAYAAKHRYNVNIPGCSKPGRMFVGQRKEGFGVNLGEIFDLINVKAPATVFDPGAEDKGLNTIADKNVTSIALELPIACVVKGNDPVIGAWTTASLRQGRLLNPMPASDIKSASREGGAWVQVSRLGMPLVNELVIGLKDKDKFNSSKPKDDSQFASYVTNPTLPALVEVLFGAAGVRAPTNLPRQDLVTAFLTGVPGLNQPLKVTPSDMLRLNTSMAPVARGAQKRLGVIAGDNAGFPNGRRPGDDVVDIELRVAMGRLCTLNLDCKPADAPSGAVDFTDGALVNDGQFDMTFPYLTTPIPGSPFVTGNANIMAAKR
ncbi:DUF4331 domain-containing protein [Chitinivorax sp. B]|uniref:DUF4331 domain-containing protein n=1 Tax=Chitinivorax sp. B TaxID=2502235 RepID=UPI0010F9F47D|nr:DUF4331 domain-containing protein [Chitinivorax sp. B]